MRECTQDFTIRRPLYNTKLQLREMDGLLWETTLSEWFASLLKRDLLQKGANLFVLSRQLYQKKIVEKESGQEVRNVVSLVKIAENLSVSS